ncbi:hypothetical protein [Enterobacter quasiroggenkampii]|uniref:hypothetical protein n=1 Tax=Enterobacter quasiroggenkampii TaxID=2497436 RepID=UPI0021D25DEA|nr:hypothetical protein [Enterobacter quasiroggenkampii]MCU6369356.1 hypothetical protein [Enterobacter quasiroggenkampii]
MTFEISIFGKKTTMTKKTSEVVAPNPQLAVFYKSIVSDIADLHATTMLVEDEADKIEAIHYDPDMRDEAKIRRKLEAANPERLKAFSTGAANISKRCEIILDYLQKELQPVKPLAEDDLMGFMRDNELRQVIRGMGGKEKTALVISLHKQKMPEVCDAILRANPLCSGLTTDQYERLAFTRTAAEATDVISSVADMISAVRVDMRKIVDVSCWYSNLIYNKNDDPKSIAVRMTGLDKLDEYVSNMQKVNEREAA